MKIWMLTWNCENQAPKDQLLTTFLNGLLPQAEQAQWPDIIVVALQEADCYATLRRTFVSHKIAETFNNNNYQLLAYPSFMGTTKPPTKCYIHLGVLIKKEQGLVVSRDPNRTQNINPPHQQINSTVVDQGSGEYRDGKFPKCKGGAYARVYYKGKKLGFIGAHLDGPAKPTACNRQIMELLRSITGATNTQPAINQALENQFDAVFFMGDLNYRLSTAAQKDTVGAIVNGLTQLGGRKSLWDYDTLNGRSHPAQQHSELITKYGFQFPRRFDVLPTYKRYYKDRTNNNPCLQLAPAFRQAQQGDIQQHISLIKQCYFQGKNDNDDSKSAKRPGYYELGWLDRIGFRLKQGVNYVPNSVSFKTLDDIVLSDHTPLIMKIEL